MLLLTLFVFRLRFSRCDAAVGGETLKISFELFLTFTKFGQRFGNHFLNFITETINWSKVRAKFAKVFKKILSWIRKFGIVSLHKFSQT